MPVHDWTRVDAGIFHAFHQAWNIAISTALNDGILPRDYYALPEQHAAGFGPDVLTLQAGGGGLDDADGLHGGDEDEGDGASSGGGLLVAAPKIAPTAETDLDFYSRKQTDIVIRHVSGDRV